MPKIPDLRDDEITFEKCSVLLERLKKVFEMFEGPGIDFTDLLGVDPSPMKNYFEERFEGYAFQRLFQSELGKGVLVGLYAHHLMNQTD